MSSSVFSRARRLALCAAAVAAFSAPVQAMAATIVGATHITIKSALPDYLQIGELLAFDFADQNVALASNGGVATALSQFFDGVAPQGGPAEAIDGVYPVNYDYTFDLGVPGVYHSGGAGANEYLTVAFAGPRTLSKIQIYGRGDCCQARDFYNVTVYGAGDAVLFSGQLDARATGNASVSFDAPVGGVPEPSSWALMILGFGGAGAVLRRRRTALA